MKGQNNTMSLPGDKPTLFESVVCGRCGGTGHYSYNTIHGSRCYGCGGRGRKMTKRGAAAQEFYRDMLKKVATEVEIGDKVLFEAGPMNAAAWITVTEVKVDGERVDIRGEDKNGLAHGLGVFRTSKVRIAQTTEAKREAREKALAFQATLTKTGAPRKTK